MTAHHTAKGIASLGRHGDDLIVHMNQEEVQGLQALAKQHGTSLTINPHTGMPEAFKLGGVFKALLPIAAGFALGPGGFGLFTGESAALMSGLTVGAATGLLTGNLGQGIMAGFGAYGGAGLGSSLKSLAPVAPGGSTAIGTTNAIQAATGSPLVGASSQFISPFTPNGIAGGAGLGLGTVNNAGIAATSGLGDVATGLTANSAGITNQYSTLGVPSPAAPSNWSQAWEGAKSLTKDGGIDRAKGILGTPAKDAAVTGTSVDAAGKVTTNYGVPTAAKPLTTGQLAMKLGTAPASAVLGGVEESDLQPNVQLPGQEEKVYEQTGVDANGKPTFGYIAKSAFNPYRTLNLSGPSPLNLGQALKLPASTSYADGGAVQPTIQSGGIRDLYGSSDNQTQAPLSSDGYGLGRLSNLASAQEMQQAKTLGYAEGGETSLNLEDQPTLNLRDQPSLNVNNPSQGSYMTPDGNGIYAGRFFKEMYRQNPDNPMLKLFGRMPDSMVWNKQMAKGGYLDGQGDGMSDSIPATIEGKQPARLADGEFVVPADVVSHLGNGSSKAGSKRLYAMLDKVRKARTGRVKQGRQINPNKYMPA
jgi:hypothetical protein